MVRFLKKNSAFSTLAGVETATLSRLDYVCINSYFLPSNTSFQLEKHSSVYFRRTQKKRKRNNPEPFLLEYVLHYYLYMVSSWVTIIVLFLEISISMTATRIQTLLLTSPPLSQVCGKRWTECYYCSTSASNHFIRSRRHPREEVDKAARNRSWRTISRWVDRPAPSN